jgi:hypothetical protein
MEPFKDDAELIAELRTERPVPSPAFTADLDERAAAGFPPRSLPGASPLDRLGARLRALPPRRWLLPTGATALAAIAVATVVVAVSEPKTDSVSIAQLSGTDRPAPPPKAHPYDNYAGNPKARASQAAGPGTGVDSSSVQSETALPTRTGRVAPAGVPLPSSASSGAASAESRPAETGPFASQAAHRDIERSAEMVLGAEPAEVGDDAAKVFDAVHASDGIVLRSSVSGGAAGDAGATFDLLIPSAKLAAFSAIAEVRSRHEATKDITSPTVRLGEHLRDSRATIDGLLVQLAGADDDAERAEVETQLGTERHHASSLESRLTTLDRRANLSHVSLRIETGTATGSTGENGGGWGMGDALGDARHILAIAAAVTIVGLAIVGPLAVIALLAWLANRAWIRHRRERALS